MKNILRTVFNSEAEIYDTTTQYLLLDYNFTLQQAVSKIPFEKEDYFSVLDLGCGTGNLVQIIREHFPNAIIYALDMCESMLNIARSKNIIGINYILQNMFDLENVQLPYFDVIISSFVFHNFSTLEQHKNILSIIFSYLAANGTIILADLIDLEDNFYKKNMRERLISLMRKHNLSNAEILNWLGTLEVEDSPLTLSQNIELLRCAGFVNITVSTFDNNNAIFVAQKEIDVIQVKTELLFYGVKLNNFVKELYLRQNPGNVWKTGNNGIFIALDGHDVLVSINHLANRESPYELVPHCNKILLKKYGQAIDLSIDSLKFPKWFFDKIPELNNRPFSDFFVFEGRQYLHLAYKYCSFSPEEKCKFCSTERRTLATDHSANEVCQALEYTIPHMPNNIQICLGGGTYIPFEENIDYFNSIIKCIRSNSATIPIWVEMIPPKLQDIELLINSGATAFGFNIEIWNDEQREKICPGKSKISKQHYIEACKFVVKKLGPNRVGSCIIVGLDSYENIKMAIDELVANGIEPCVLPYKSYDQTNLEGYIIPASYRRDFYMLSKYAAKISKDKNIIFSENQGCLKCSCCTVVHDFQGVLNK